MKKWENILISHTTRHTTHTEKRLKVSSPKIPYEYWADLTKNKDYFLKVDLNNRVIIKEYLRSSKSYFLQISHSLIFVLRLTDNFT